MEHTSLFCEDLTVDSVKIRNPYYAQNGDGIDVESCTNVHIHHSTFETGDDAICMKSGKMPLPAGSKALVAMSTFMIVW